MCLIDDANIRRFSGLHQMFLSILYEMPCLLYELKSYPSRFSISGIFVASNPTNNHYSIGNLPHIIRSVTFKLIMFFYQEIHFRVSTLSSLELR